MVYVSQMQPDGALYRQREDWEELAKLDPYWAILSVPSKRYGRWDSEEFFTTGDREIGEVMRHAADLGFPRSFYKALDFGCGLGRLTRSMTKYFAHCIGVDIAETMIQRASEIHSEWPSCRFTLNVRPDLQIFPSSQFDFVYSSIVLQHLPTRDLIRTYIAEFIRVMRPQGLAVFQILSYVPWKYRLQPTRRLYRFLRSMHCSSIWLYRRLGLTPIRNNYIPERDVLTWIGSCGGTTLRSEPNDAGPPGIRTCTYYVTR